MGEVRRVPLRSDWGPTPREVRSRPEKEGEEKDREPLLGGEGTDAGS